jgi:hypothetical protein
MITQSSAHTARTGGVPKPGDLRTEKFAVDGDEMSQVFGYIAVFKNRLRRAHRHADGAVDTFIRVYVVSARPFVNAVDRATTDATGVFAVDAGVSDDVGHASALRVDQRPFQTGLRFC